MNRPQVGTLVDWAGTRHAPAGPAPRIACLVPSLTELLFALGLGPHVVARTGFCIHPRDAVRAVPKIGGTKDPDLARLRQLAPTHLLVNIDENRKEVVDAARAFIPHILVTHPATPEDNLRLYELVGAVFDCEVPGAALGRRLREARAAAQHVTAELARERVLYLIWRKPWMTVARGTYVASTLAEVGWDTVVQDAEPRYPALSDDAPLWRTADRILLATEPYAFRPRDAQELAVRHGRPVHLIDGEWTSWYGPRAIDGLHALAQFRRALANNAVHD